MKKIYISIPITGLPHSSVMAKADKAKNKIANDGNVPISPLDIDAGANPTYCDYICSDLRAMLECDAIYFCKGWELSCGCNIEHRVAQTLNMFGKKQFQFIYE